jgi:cysteine desulfurase
LYVSKKTKFQPFVIGGHQERSRRGGTENVPYIVGFGRAADLALERLDEENTRVREMRDLLESTIVQTIPNTRVNGAGALRLPNTLNVSFEYVEAEALLMLLDQAGICASSGSACTTGSLEPSHVLTAMGLTPAQARGSLRLSLSVENTLEEIQYLAEQLRQSVQRLRSFSPLAQRSPAVARVR